MGGLFSKPDVVKPALPAAEPAIPLPPEVIEEAGDEERRRARRRSGRRKTVITGELEPETDKKALLG